MPDISMCVSGTCRLKEKCYRNSESGTEPSEFRQSFFVPADDTDKSPCGYFWDRKEGE